MPYALKLGLLEPEVIVISNGDAGVIFHHGLFSRVESRKVSCGVCNLRVSNVSVKSRAVVFTVVVAVGRNDEL